MSPGDAPAAYLDRNQTVTNRPVVYNSMGAAATPALAYEQHVRSTNRATTDSVG